MREPVEFNLHLSARAENVAVVRASLEGLARALDFDAELNADLKTAVSEACNNVCLHAYPGGEVGPMTVTLRAHPDGVEAVVRDRGQGMGRISTRADRMGLGLAVINALAARSLYMTPPDGGTEVRLWFARAIRAVENPPEVARAEGDLTLVPEWLASEVVLWCTPPSLQHHLLLRVMTYLAAAAHFTITSVETLARLNGTLAEQVNAGADGWIAAGIDTRPRRLQLTLGPLADSGRPDPPAGDPVETVDSLQLDGHVALRLAIADRRGG